MAVNALIGALRFVFGADVAQLETASKRAGKSMRDASRNVQSSGDRIVAALTRIGAAAVAAFGIAGLQQAVQQAVQATARLGELADRAGLTREAFQELEFAFRGLGVEQGRLAVAGQRLTAELENLRAGTGRLHTFLTRVNPELIATFAGATTAADGFQLLAREIARTESPAQQLLLAQKALGENLGAQLLPALRDGSDALSEAREEARRLGIVLSDETVRAAEELDQAWEDLTLRMQRSWQRMVLGILAPTFTQRMAEVQAALETWQSRMAANAEGTAQWRIALMGANRELAAMLELVRERGIGDNEFAPFPGVPSGAGEGGRGGDDRNAMSEAFAELRQLTSLMQGQKPLFEALNTDWNAHGDKVAEAIRRINDQYGESAEARRRLANVNRQMALKEQQDLIDTAQNVSRTIRALWPKEKAAAIASAVIDTAAGIAKTLGKYGGTPLGFANAALVAAQGAAQIAAIKSTNLGGGGSVPSVGGGSAAVATEPATPQPQTAITVDLHGSTFTREQVRELLEQMNEFTLDGGTLIATVGH